MAQIITYVDGRYSTVELDSKEKVMISVAQTGICLFEMRFMGLFRKRTIAEWKPQEMDDFLNKLGGAGTTGTPFAYTVKKLMSYPSIKAIEAFLKNSN